MSEQQTISPQAGSPPAEALTAELLSDLREGFRMDAADRARRNAVTNNEINALALNRDAVRGDDGHFSHRVKSKGITDQQKSGRCWMYAALNVLRPQVIRDHRMKSFEFSTAYLQFWDKMEKANLYLESVIELRDADYLDRDWEIVNRWTIEDGGWWNFVVDLIEKYGVVPLAAMPETHSSSNTATINEVLGRLLRKWGARLLEQHEAGATVSDLREGKKEALREVYRFLVITFGEPPTEFTWRFQHTRKSPGEDPGAAMKSAREEDLSGGEAFTPLSFYRKFVAAPLSEFVCLYNDPKNALDRHYRFRRAHNVVECECMHFVNVGIETMKEVAVASIVANEPLWFAVNMHFDQSTKHGLMARQLFDYEALFGLDLTLGKADRTKFHAGASNHAMVLMGVDLDGDGKPRKWLVENSWGDEKGKDGCWTLQDPWFEEHVYTVIAHRRHVPPAVLERFDDKPTDLPAWYPGAPGVRG